MENANPVIEQLKARFRVATDSDLALKLSVSRSTVANWRNRNSVPVRYQRIAEGDVTTTAWARAIAELSDLEEAGLQLATLRFLRAYAPVAADYRAFISKGGEIALDFFDIWERACVDIQNAMDKEGNEHPHTIMTLLAFDEMK